MVRFIFFDIDGTLIHTNGAGVEAFGRAFTGEFGVPQPTAGMKFAGRTDTGLAREMFERHGIPPTPANLRRFFDQYVFWLDHLLAGREGAVCPGVWEFLRAAREIAPSPVLGLLTGNLRLGAEIKLRRFQLWDEFVFGGFADDHEDRNQIAKAAHERARRLHGREVPGPEMVVIGDTAHDIRCGRAIGARVLAVATGGESFEQLAAHEPDWLVRDLREFPAKKLLERRVD